MYAAEGDGLKNYFTLLSYIRQPAAAGFDAYTQMHYPFGDYVFFTDNTPIIAVLLRAFSLHIYDITGYEIAIMHAFLVLNMLIAPFIVYKILNKFIQHDWVKLIGTIAIVWTSPMFLRLYTGTYNLSFSVLFFLAILFVLNITEGFKNKSNKTILKYSLYLFILNTIASFFHLYYILIIGLPCTVFLFTLYIFYFRSTAIKWIYKLCPLILVGMSVFVVLYSIHYTDGYHALRLSVPEGHDIKEWEVQFDALYKARSTINSMSLLGGFSGAGAEQSIFLGNVFWYGIVCIIALTIFQNIYLKIKFSLLAKNNSYLILFAATAIVCYFSAAGDRIVLFHTITMDNIFNPLYYITKIYPPVDQFRYLGRVAWGCFFMLHFMFLIALDMFAMQSNKNIRRTILAALTCIVLIDAKDIIVNMRLFENKNIFSTDSMSALPELNYNTYQAILPIPYYDVGCENYNYTIDDNNAWSSYTYQLQLKSRLPLMSAKLSRTPPEFVKDFFSIFISDSIHAHLLSALNSKPILVVYDNSVKQQSERYPASAVIECEADAIEKYNMQLVFTDGNILYYKWNIK